MTRPLGILVRDRIEFPAQVQRRARIHQDARQARQREHEHGSIQQDVVKDDHSCHPQRPRPEISAVHEIRFLGIIADSAVYHSC